MVLDPIGALEKFNLQYDCTCWLAWCWYDLIHLICVWWLCANHAFYIYWLLLSLNKQSKSFAHTHKNGFKTIKSFYHSDKSFFTDLWNRCILWNAHVYERFSFSDSSLGFCHGHDNLSWSIFNGHDNTAMILKSWLWNIMQKPWKNHESA